MAKTRKAGKNTGQQPPSAAGKTPPKDKKDIRISWRWSKFDPDYPPGGRSFGEDFDEHLLKRMQALEDRSVAALNNPKYPAYDEYDVGTLSKASRDRLRERKIDTPTLAHIEIAGRRRLWAVPPDESGVAFLVWYDPDHKVQPWKKDQKARNTERKRRKGR